MMILKKISCMGLLGLILLLSSCAEQRVVKKEIDPKERDYKGQAPIINLYDDRTSLTERR